MFPARTSVLAAAALLAAIMSGCDSNKKSESSAAAAREKPITVSDSASVEVSARVKAIDYATRVVTLVDADGESLEFVAGPEIRRLNEVRVGDSVRAEYVVSLLAELRPPTAEEAANPIEVIAIKGRTPSGQTPAGGAGIATRIVTTVESVSVPNMRVTLKGPMGDTTTVRARNPENIRKLSIGDTIVITYTEAMGVSLVKAGAN